MSSGDDPPKPPKKPRTKTDPKPRRKSDPAIKAQRRSQPSIQIPPLEPTAENANPEETKPEKAKPEQVAAKITFDAERETPKAEPPEAEKAAAAESDTAKPEPAASEVSAPVPTASDEAGDRIAWRISAVEIPKPETDRTPEPSPGASGSVDVQVSATELPKTTDDAAVRELAANKPDDAATRELAAQKVGEAGKLTAEQATELVRAGASGSVDISLASSTGIPQTVSASDSQPTALESQPVSGSGPIPAVVATNEGSGPLRAGRGKRVTATMQAALSGGVEKLGQGIGAVGEGVAKLGDVTRKVPLVGAGVGKLGEGLTKAGESIHALPRVAQTRRGRLLVRSVVVGFTLVFIWIAVIVGFQLRAHDTPDFRPDAERILVEMGKGPASISQVYEHASPRFQELVKKERFIDDMTDLYATNGKFREITAINETLVTTGPTGRVGRVGLTALFEKGISRGSISFHWDKGEWKLLGVGIEVPDNVEITQTQRELRVAACIDDKGKDVSDQRSKCLVRDAAETILELIRDGRAGEVWDAANDIFKQQESRERFIQIQEEQRQALGNWKRVLNVTDARAIAGLTSTFDIVCEYERSSGVRVEFDFTRPSKFERWKLARFKVTLPMPRPTEVPAADTGAPMDAGVSPPL